MRRSTIANGDLVSLEVSLAPAKDPIGNPNGLPLFEATVINYGSDVADYGICFNVRSADGTSVIRKSAMARNGLKPGQQAVFNEGFALLTPTDATATDVQVVRTPSCEYDGSC
jgi:hypothetical protein